MPHQASEGQGRKTPPSGRPVFPIYSLRVFHEVSRAERPSQQARRTVLHSSKEACICELWYIYHKSTGSGDIRVRCVESRGLRVEIEGTAAALPSASRKRFRTAGPTSRASSKAAKRRCARFA